MRSKADREAEWIIARKSGQVLLVVMGLVVAVPFLLRGQSMQRNRYHTVEDCRRDYDYGKCEHVSGRGYYGVRGAVGPWYPEDPAKRKLGDTGSGRTTAASLHYGAGDGILGTERGYRDGIRGGFGSTGRVRAVSS